MIAALSIVDDMAKLVLKNPNITARELADALGYAEQKSIYYWLDKAGYKGMKDFREEVLRGAFPLPMEKSQPELVRDGLKSLPVYSKGGIREPRSDLGDFLRGYLGPESFGVMLEGDVVIIDPSAVQTQGDLVLIRSEGTLKLTRRYSLPGRLEAYVLESDEKRLVTPEYIAGKVVFILKRTL